MKTLILVLFLVTVLAIVPAFAYPTYSGYDATTLFNGIYGDWTIIGNPYGLFDMGSPVPIWSVGVHERTGGGLVYDLDILFSNDGQYGFASINYLMDLSQINHPAVVWANATFEPITARYVQVFIDSNGTYIQADELMINGIDGAGNPIPEPSGLLALCGGIAGLLTIRRRRK